MCSGGVDSSLLVYFLIQNNKNFIGINNYYPKHYLNDLDKLNSLKQFFLFNTKKISVDSKKYKQGMMLSFNFNYFGNTYAPTLFYSINFNKDNKNKILMTGSGPDELFYGMEKYDLNFFKKLSHLETSTALEKIDTNYNEIFYRNILNPCGIEILNNIKLKRKKLYKKIAIINKNLLEAQRILSYCTVTNQHFEMFEKLSKSFNLKHISPFLDKRYIQFAFSFKIKNFLDYKNNSYLDANAGKRQLKKMLTNITSKKHAYDKKIGFHAPISKMINEKQIKNNLKINFNYEVLEKIIDIDKLEMYLRKKSKQNSEIYNIYSLIGVHQMLIQSSL